MSTQTVLTTEPARVRSAPRRGPARQWWRWPVRLASLAVFVATWEYLTTAKIRYVLNFDKLPSFTQTLHAWQTQIASGQYYADLTTSLTRILVGFLVAAVLGVAAGIGVARSRVLADVFSPVLEVIRPIPAIALVPVAILLFPVNEQGIVFITGAAAFFPVWVATRHAVRALNPAHEDAVRTMGGGRARVLWSVVLPGALPGVFSGLSTGIGVSWICLISAEMISGQYGIGYRTWSSYTIVDYPNVLVGMFSIGVLGLLTAAAVEFLGRRLTRWLPKERRSR